MGMSSKFFEGLEDRRLMSTSLINGVLRVTGTNGANRVDIDQNAGTIYVFENLILTRLAPVTQVNAIAFDAYGGNDTLLATPAVTKNITVYAGAGDDYIQTGSGNDNVLLGLGNDYVDSGAGNDNLDGSDGTDTMWGGLGNDTISGALGTDFVFGGADNDLIYGSENDDYLFGENGNDTIYGGNGADQISGGNGYDMVYGEAGDDRFYEKDRRRDYINGGDGFDRANIDKATISNGFVSDVYRELENVY
jgi:Ca2+-binding RTX toxin-like protein